MFALRLLRCPLLRIKYGVGSLARGGLVVWRRQRLAIDVSALTRRLAAVMRRAGFGALRPAATTLCGSSFGFRMETFALCIGALAMSPTLAVTHDDGAAISRPSTATAPAMPPADKVPIGTQPFADHRNPPSYRKLSDAEFARYDLGMAAFNTQFVPAGTPNAGRRAGVGPLFNSSSCDTCHNNGAHGRGPTGDGPAPTALVIQLATTPTKSPIDPEGDPVYGRVLNTVALDGVPPEGEAMIHYQETPGRYPDGSAFSLRVPHYTLTNLRYGPVSPRTLIKPRLAPALFGAGLLDAAAIAAGEAGTAATGAAAISAAKSDSGESHATTQGASAQNAAQPRAAMQDASRSRATNSEQAHSAAHDNATTHVMALEQAHGHFGWQATALSVEDQTARAFSREMGLTSSEIPHDDCTPAETACLHAPSNGSPEVSAEIFNAVLSFQRYLAVPASPTPHTIPDQDVRTFTDLGCAVCHQPRLAVTLTDADGRGYAAVIAPYTDLRLHDLGTRLADETVAGKKVSSKWRTAPLWGLGYRMTLEHFPTFLHDGRARSAEEAILWHDGEAAAARKNFEELPAPQRKGFLHWLETL